MGRAGARVVEVAVSHLVVAAVVRWAEEAPAVHQQEAVVVVVV